jgi:DNA sulfur modification protein DndC
MSNFDTDQIDANDYTYDELLTYFTNLVNEARDEIKHQYLSGPDGKWKISWSGGKDSTVLLALVIDTLLELRQSGHRLTRKVEIRMSNTKVENIVLDEYMRDEAEKVNKFCYDNDIPAQVEIVERDTEQGYFYLTIGKGYFLPLQNGRGRWCTDRLKIKPMESSVDMDEIALDLVGVRMTESGVRGRKIKKIQTDKNEMIAENGTFMPIVNFTIEDVWDYLAEYSVPWGSSKTVRELYKDATGECGFTNPAGMEKKVSKLEACGARFGCWVCPVIAIDKSTEAQMLKYAWLEPLIKWRNLQMMIHGLYMPNKTTHSHLERKQLTALRKEWKEHNILIKRTVKSGYKRNGTRLKDGQGCITLIARRFMLDSLLVCQEKYQQMRVSEGLPAGHLVSPIEVAFIKRMWKEDKKERPHLEDNELGLDFNSLLDLWGDTAKYFQK